MIGPDDEVPSPSFTERLDHELELERIGHRLEPADVVLVWTGTDLRRPGYETASPGLRPDATEYLVDSGVRLIGIDAWGLDRAFHVMIAEKQRGELDQIWESHLLGREKPYADRAAGEPRGATDTDRLHRLRLPVQDRGRERRLGARGGDLRGVTRADGAAHLQLAFHP